MRIHRFAQITQIHGAKSEELRARSQGPGSTWLFALRSLPCVIGGSVDLLHDELKRIGHLELFVQQLPNFSYMLLSRADVPDRKSQCQLVVELRV
jgi:hypothetical protein